MQYSLFCELFLFTVDWNSFNPRWFFLSKEVDISVYSNYINKLFVPVISLQINQHFMCTYIIDHI